MGYEREEDAKTRELRAVEEGIDRRRRTGLRRKIYVLLGVVAVPLVLYIGYQLLHLYDDLRAAELQRAERDAAVISVSFGRFVHQMIEEGQAVGLALTEGRMSEEEARAYLLSLGRHAPISNFSLLRADGTIMFSIDATRAAAIGRSPAFSEVLQGRPYGLSYAPLDPDRRPKTVILTPLRPTSGGVMAVSIDVTSLAGVLPPEAGQGVVVLTDADGRLVYTNESRLSTGSAIARITLVREALSGRTGVGSDVSLPGVTGTFLGAQVPIADTGWTAGLYRPAGVALGHVAREMVLATGAVLLILLLAGVVAARIVQGILSPIERLTAAAERIREGELRTPIDVRTNDEIGVFADTFREMEAGLDHAFASLRELARAGRRLNETVGVPEVAVVGLESIAGLLRADASVLTVKLPGRRSERFDSGTDESLAAIDGLRGAVADGLLEEVGRHISYVTPASIGPRRLVSLALRQERQLLGRVDLLARPERSEQEFEAGDVRLAEGLAEQLSIALVNAQRFETESAVAETLQDSLITEPFPVPQTDLGVVYRPALAGARVGGDFYDLIRFEEPTYGLAIGDISGHGLAAAGYVVAAKGALRSFALDDPSPATVLARTDAALARQLPPGMFVTAFYAVLDVGTGTVRYASAGHPAPLLLRKDGRLSQLLLGGAPLGLSEAGEYAESELTLEPGDRLIAYTDGLTEARATGQALLGERRVAELAASSLGGTASETAEMLAREAEEYAEGELPDDLTVVVLGRRAQRETLPVSVAGPVHRPVRG